MYVKMKRREVDLSFGDNRVTARVRTLGFAVCCVSEFLRCVSWIGIAIIVVVSVIFQVELDVVPLYVLTLLVAGVAHFIVTSCATWLEYPYWLDVEVLSDGRNRVSRPFIVANLIFACLLTYYGDWAIACYAFISALLLDLAFSLASERYAETVIRELRRMTELACQPCKTPLISTSDICELTPTSESLDLTSSRDDEQDETRILSFERTRSSEFERIVGTALVEFEPNSSFAVLNIAFCPPMKDPPIFEYEQIGGVDSTFKISNLQTYGVRIEVKRSCVDNEEPVLIEFYAQSPVRG